MSVKRCSSITTALSIPQNLNDAPQFVAEANDICANRLQVGLGDTTPLNNYELVIGSLYKIPVGGVGIPPGGCRLVYPGGPFACGGTNIETFLELENDNDILSYFGSINAANFIGSINLLETRYCFECQEKTVITVNNPSPEDPLGPSEPSGPPKEGTTPPSGPCSILGPLSVLLDGTVIDGNTNTTIPQECCTEAVAGTQVFWDTTGGSGDSETPPRCRIVPKPCEGIVTAEGPGGVIIGINEEQCCTKDVVGKDVYWDGRVCLLNSTPCNTIKNITVGPAQEYQIFGDGVPLKEECCTNDITGLDVVWEYYPVVTKGKSGDVITNVAMCRQVQPIAPVIDIVLNEKPIETDVCDEIVTSMWLYFGSPNPICDGGVPEPPPEPPIFPPPVTPPPIEDPNEPIKTNDGLPPPVISPPPSNSASRFTVNGADCCYDRSNPIIGVIKTDNPNVVVNTVAIFHSENDGFDTWAGLTVNLSNTLGNPFNLILEFTGGLTDCCDYDIHIDDIRIDCFRDEDRLIWRNTDCPGFDIKHVIDNKKSWVYNTGLPTIGNTEYDDIVRSGGDFGLMEPYSTINRTFAPSPDANIPWRYTDYLNQSGILEKHSKLVLNSKEVFLTYNMCTPEDCNISGNTVTLLELESYKKVFQSFWVQMVEQFIPATTIFVAGEKWCNAPDIICSEFEECDYDFEFVEGEVTSIVFETDGSDIPSPSQPPSTLPDENGGRFNEDNQPNGETGTSEDGPITLPGVTIIPPESELGSTTRIPGLPPSNGLINERNLFLNKFTETKTEIVFE